MAINVRHDVPFGIAGGLAHQTGRGLAQADYDRLLLDQARIDAQLQERAREFDLSLASRAQQQAIDNQRYQDSIAAQQQGQQAAAQNAFAMDALNQQQALELLGANQQFAWQQQAAQTVDQQAATALKDARAMNLDPEGKRLLGEMAGRLSEIRGERGVLRPEVYNDIMGQWLGEFNDTGLDAYAVKEPTPEERMQRGLLPMEGQQLTPGAPPPPGLYWKSNGIRNGEETFDPYVVHGPDGPRSRPAGDGGTLVEQTDGSWEHIPPPKPVTPPKPTVDPNALGPTDYLSAYKQAWAQLHQAAIAEGKETETSPATYKPPTPEAVKNLAQEIISGMQPPDEGGGVLDSISELIGGMLGGQGAVSQNFSGAGTQGDPIRFNAPPTEADVIALKPGTWFVAPDGSLRQR